MANEQKPKSAVILRWVKGEIPLKAERVVIGVGSELFPKLEFTSLACLYPDDTYVLFGGTLNTAQEHRQEILDLRLRPALQKYNMSQAIAAWPAAAARVRSYGLPIGFYAKGVYPPSSEVHIRRHFVVLWAVQGVPIGYFLHRMQELIKRMSK